MFVLNFLRVEHIPPYCVSLFQVFQIFRFSFFHAKRIVKVSGKKENHCERHVIFQNTEHHFQENILLHPHHYCF